MCQSEKAAKRWKWRFLHKKNAAKKAAKLKKKSEKAAKLKIEEKRRGLLKQIAELDQKVEKAKPAAGK